MKKIIKIKESNILDIVGKIIEEEVTNQKQIVISASDSLGVSPSFDGTKNLMNSLKQKVERALRGGTPYKVVPDSRGNVAIATKDGGNLKLEVTLVETTEKDRHWYFDCSVAILSELKKESEDILRAKLVEKAGLRGQTFRGSKIQNLGLNSIGLSGFKNLDPNAPDKIFILYILYIVGSRPVNYQDVMGDDDAVVPATQGSKDKPTQNTQSSNIDVASKATNELNEVVTSGYTASDCDALHAFQSRKVGGESQLVGNMHVIVGQKLEELYGKGYNPMVTDVKVTVNGMSVKWTCTIKNSPDGKAWVGFTSRGAGCNSDVVYRSENAKGNDPQSIIANIKQVYGESSIDFQKISEVNYTVDEGSEEEKRNSFRQIFYVYTKPKSFPPHK